MFIVISSALSERIKNYDSPSGCTCKFDIVLIFQAIRAPWSFYSCCQSHFSPILMLVLCNLAGILIYDVHIFKSQTGELKKLLTFWILVVYHVCRRVFPVLSFLSHSLFVLMRWLCAGKSARGKHPNYKKIWPNYSRPIVC